MGMAQKNTLRFLATILVSTWLFYACVGDDVNQFRGHIDGGIEQITLIKSGLHYKYSSNEMITISVDEQGRFRTDLSLNEAAVYYIRLFEVDYPVYLEPGKRTNISIATGRFPFDVTVRGYSRELNQQYQLYLSQIMNLERHSRSERRNFLAGEPNDYLNMMRLRVHLAKEYLAGTPFENILLRNNGEYIVTKLEAIRLRKHDEKFRVDQARDQVLKFAVESGFFNYSSLVAQRAGIRDFADAWSKTFNIQSETEALFGRPLMEYDWKRIAFKDLNRVKMSLLDHITDEDANQHAMMYLLAEMIAEGPFDEALKIYNDLTKDLTLNPTYSTFLSELLRDVKQVQPGEVAPSFSLYDINGELYTMDSFRGRYVLLDFWASWCAPCLEEFPHMQRIHKAYKEDDLIIVSISIDENQFSWKQTLEKNNLPWVQLYAGEGFSQATFQEYRAGGIPFYVLVDRNGEIKKLNDVRPSFNFEDVFEEILYLEQYYALSGLRIR
jgi:thiol-disulfide isomerase/thioredoxin